MAQNTNANQNDNGNENGKAKIPWGTKAGYIGTGVLIGLVVYPFVRKAIRKLQPKLDEILDGLTGKAEDLTERASDILARAKENLRGKERKSDHDHLHSH